MFVRVTHLFCRFLCSLLQNLKSVAHVLLDSCDFGLALRIGRYHSDHETGVRGCVWTREGHERAWLSIESGMSLRDGSSKAETQYATANSNLL